MSRPPNAPWTEQSSKRDLYAASVVEAPSPDGRVRVSRIISGVGAAIAIIARKATAKLGYVPHSYQSNVAVEAVQDATELATSAVAGKLEGASLEGELKRAQIAELYANARRANAEAGVIEADAAWAHVDRSIRLMQSLGAPVGLSRLPDGRLCISLGDNLSNGIPIVEIPVQSSNPVREDGPPTIVGVASTASGAASSAGKGHTGSAGGQNDESSTAPAAENPELDETR